MKKHNLWELNFSTWKKYIFILEYTYRQIECGSSSVGRVSAFQADCREFESRLPLHY